MTRSRLLLACITVASVVAIAGCGSSGHSATSGATRRASTTSAQGQRAATAAEFAGAYVRFLDGARTAAALPDATEAAARRLQRFLSQPFAVTEAFTGIPGRSVSRADTLKGCRAILDGEADDWAESSLYMVGTLDEARAKEVAAAKQGVPA